ncbi:DUF4760 domain-containing protein [Candidatus Bathyarchaeota archaeon]|nr:DUF4760 domain-containing protein [Candidatus Bathyarchaeota archaeon]
MVDLVELQALAYVAQIVGVAGTLTAAFIAVRSYISSNKRSEEAKRKEQETRERELETRQAQLFMQIYLRWSEKDFVEAYNHIHFIEPPVYKDLDDYIEKYVKNDPEYDLKVTQISALLEGVGVLVNRGLIDVSYVDDLFSGMVIRHWEAIRPSILEWRVRVNEPQSLEWLEYLYNRVKAVAEGQHPELRDGVRPLYKQATP